MAQGKLIEIDAVMDNYPEVIEQKEESCQPANSKERESMTQDELHFIMPMTKVSKMTSSMP